MLRITTWKTKAAANTRYSNTNDGTQHLDMAQVYSLTWATIKVHHANSLTNTGAHHDIPYEYFWFQNFITFRVNVFLFEILNTTQKSRTKRVSDGPRSR
jgi:hypothetical protein